METHAQKPAVAAGPHLYPLNSFASL